MKYRLIPKNDEATIFGIWLQDYSLPWNERYKGEIDIEKFLAR